MDQSRSVTLFHCDAHGLVVERDELSPVALVVPQEEPVRVVVDDLDGRLHVAAGPVPEGWPP